MTLIRLKPARELLRDSMIPESFLNVIDGMFNDGLGKFERNLHFSPRVDVAENKDAYSIRVSLPGMKKDEIKVETEDGFVIISGERKFKKENDEKFHAIENFYGNFQRSFELPANVDASKIDATLTDGILTILIPKVDEVKNSRQGISIK